MVKRCFSYALFYNQDYATQSNVYWNQLMAASIVGSIPIVIAFLALQRYIVQGLTSRCSEVGVVAVPCPRSLERLYRV
jgi:ABC-type glycerol-3-phosphate transport system permease component